jgi:hypothetical protein
MTVTLITRDGPLTYQQNDVKYSKLLSLLIDDDDDDNIYIPISQFSSEIVKLQMSILQMNNNNIFNTFNTPIKINNTDNIIYMNAVGDELSVIAQLLNIANYLDIQQIVELCCAKLAMIFKQSLPDELESKYITNISIDI